MSNTNNDFDNNLDKNESYFGFDEELVVDKVDVQNDNYK